MKFNATVTNVENGDEYRVEDISSDSEDEAKKIAVNEYYYKNIEFDGFFVDVFLEELDGAE